MSNVAHLFSGAAFPSLPLHLTPFITISLSQQNTACGKSHHASTFAVIAATHAYWHGSPAHGIELLHGVGDRQRRLTAIRPLPSFSRTQVHLTRLCAAQVLRLFYTALPTH